jgi:hypothetical protein
MGERVLATVAELCPGKPVRSLLMSHHHRLSSQGLRPYVQRGVTVFGTPGNRAYLEDLATRAYQLQPDAQARDPQPLRLQLVAERQLFKDETQEVEVRLFWDSTHTDEYLLLHLPKLRTVVEGDLLYLPPGEAAVPSGQRSAALMKGIDQLGLDVDFVLQTFPLDDRYLKVPVTPPTEK